MSYQQAEHHEIWLPIATSGGEWRISQQTTGPRGGKGWKKLHSCPATGGTQQMFLEPGTYKINYWFPGNPVPRKAALEVTDAGEIIYID